MSQPIQIDTEVALDQFVKRYTDNQGKQIDNSSLPAGAPMIYYCRHCGAHTATLSEGHMSRPKTICNPCEVLDAHGLIPEGVKRAKQTVTGVMAAGSR